MKREYKPQFEKNFSDPEIREEIIDCCSMCKKPSVSLHKGICFECRKNQDRKDTLNTKENFELYKKWRNREAVSSVFLWGWAVVIWKKFGGLTTMLLYGAALSVLIIIAFRNELSLLGWLCMGFGTLVILVLAVIRMMNNDSRYRTDFEKLNASIIVVDEDERWKCPCCNISNQYQANCDVCGIKPHFLKIETNGQKQ